MNIQAQLQEAADKAGFSQADLAVWLQYERTNVVRWLNGSNEPLPHRQKYLAEQLALLKKVLKVKKSPLPVPPSITQHERKAYIEGVRDSALKGIFRAGVAG